MNRVMAKVVPWTRLPILAVIGALVVMFVGLLVAASMVSRRLEREESGIASSCLQQLPVGSLLHQFCCQNHDSISHTYSRKWEIKAIWFWVSARVLEDPTSASASMAAVGSSKHQIFTSSHIKPELFSHSAAESSCPPLNQRPN